MARDLEISAENSIKLFDPLEKSEVEFYYRTPTSEDRVRYMTARYKRQGGVLIDRSRTAAIDAAAEVLTGIRPGDFTHGKAPLASTPGAEGYREDWKELVRAAAGDLLFLMGTDLFEGRISLDVIKGMNIVSEFAPDTPAPEPEAAELPPLPTSSGDSESGALRNEESSA